MNHLLAAACASITGISLGIALHHQHCLSQTSTHSATGLNEQATYEAFPPQQSHSFQRTPATRSHSAVTGVSPIEQKLSNLLDQQETMKNQQSELNRELNAIQFRLDTHSASFRPLQSERETEVLRSKQNTLSPLLPPRQ